MAGWSTVYHLHVWGSWPRLLSSLPYSFSSKIIWWESSKRTCTNILTLIRPLLVLYLLCFTGQRKACGHIESHHGSRPHKDVATGSGEFIGGFMVEIRSPSEMLC